MQHNVRFWDYFVLNSELWINVAWYIIRDVSDEKLLSLNGLIFDTENEDNIFFLNIGVYLNVYTVFHPRKKNVFVLNNIQLSQLHIELFLANA